MSAGLTQMLNNVDPVPAARLVITLYQLPTLLSLGQLLFPLSDSSTDAADHVTC